jgi:hypothetical protein
VGPSGREAVADISGTAVGGMDEHEAEARIGGVEGNGTGQAERVVVRGSYDQSERAGSRHAGRRPTTPGRSLQG